jgi:hypothetical protein
MAISIFTYTFPLMDIISAYAPNGESRPEEIFSLFSRFFISLSSVETSIPIMICGNRKPIQIEKDSQSGPS